MHRMGILVFIKCSHPPIFSALKIIFDVQKRTKWEIITSYPYFNHKIG